ncbi:MAG: ABC transporter permease [Deltaproteobacteria bacterium]|nr:ABC transporter permease [Deltaproteobacteria bacterium]MBW2016747.1 ABC transporter permease [Deltaproteobacteria bacterium]MBW2129321.1 ABC transporter permease [Deltaproteobacteria bacterium]MBW2304226.1 ABC transporter permease [Deltaproteobacteria bacterium]
MVIRLAWRNIWRNRRRTIITLFSIGMGLTFSLFFIALGEGVYDQMIDQIVRMQAGHITLQHPKYRDAPSVDQWIEIPQELRREIERWPEVESTKMLVLGQGIAKTGSGNVAAAIMGVEPGVERQSSPLAKNLVEGAYLQEKDKSLVVLGLEMAERLHLGLGKKLVISTNDVNGMLVDQLCRVKGIYRTGSDEMDAYVIQVPITFARRLFNMPEKGATEMGVILKNPGFQEAVLKKIQARTRDLGVSVLTWQEVLPQVASYIRMDKGSNWVLQGILIFLILFTIFNTMLMSVLERKREFAMLLALGTAPGKLRLQVFMESVLLGFIGSCGGMLMGSLAVYLGHRYGINMSAIMGDSVNISGFAVSTKMHTKFSYGIILGTTAVVFGATVLLSLLPMRHATKLSIVENIK